MQDILSYFPIKIREELKGFNLKLLEEIRIRNSRPIFLKIGQDELNTNCTVNTEEVLEILQRICDNSIYTYQNQICNGYITIKGGHRVGITGNVVMKDGQVINISHIYSLNFRIARQVFDCSNCILKDMVDIDHNTIQNTLIISPPGFRKNNNIKRFGKKNK